MPRLNLAICAATLGFSALFLPSVTGQESDSGRLGVPRDWSHRHVVFPQAQDYERLSGIQSDPRYWHQVQTRSMPVVERSATFNLKRLPPRPVNTPNLRPKVDWGESMGTSALAYTGLQSYPAKYSFNVANPTPNCNSDYVVYTTPTGVNTRYNLIAFKNLYVNDAGTGSCSGTLPTPMFAYFASQNSGPLNSSPALSLDGTQVAFVENSAPAQFHVVKWRNGDVSNTFGNPYNAAKMVNCATNAAVAPCEWSLTYTTAAKATLSAPFMDYMNDIAYVSDDAGKVYAVKPVFGGGQPAIVWSVALNASYTMTAPVYDSVSKNLFVADSSGFLYYVRTSSSSAGTCATGSPPCAGARSLDVAGGVAVVDAPIVDSTNGKVFVISSNSPVTKNPSVVQTDTTLSTSVVAYIGTSGANPLYSGAFSNAYYSNPGTGLLYVCGNGPSAAIPQLYAISFTGTTMNAGTAAFGPQPMATSSAGACGSVTEVFNQSLNRDELYTSVTNKCSATVTGGCVRQFDITSGFPSGGASNIVSEAGGTLGIVVDNVTNSLRGDQSETNIYFMTRTAQTCNKHTGLAAGTTNTSSCAVKLTQNSLQ